MSENRLNEELAAIEAALSSLTPAASGVQRDRLMFLAGRASVDKLPRSSYRSLTPPHCNGGAFFGGRNFLAASLVATTSVAATVLVMLMAQRGPQMADQKVAPTFTSPAPSTETRTVNADAETRGSVAYASYRAAMRNWLAEAERSRISADIKLPDDPLPGGNLLADNNSASVVDAGGAARQSETYEGLESVLRELDIDRGVPPQRKSPQSYRKENHL